MRIKHIQQAVILGWVAMNLKEEDDHDIMVRMSVDEVLDMKVVQSFILVNAEYPRNLDCDHREEFWKIITSERQNCEEEAMKYYNLHKRQSDE